MQRIKVFMFHKMNAVECLFAHCSVTSDKLL